MNRHERRKAEALIRKAKTHDEALRIWSEQMKHRSKYAKRDTRSWEGNRWR